MKKNYSDMVEQKDSLDKKLQESSEKFEGARKRLENIIMAKSKQDNSNEKKEHEQTRSLEDELIENTEQQRTHALLQRILNFNGKIVECVLDEDVEFIETTIHDCTVKLKEIIENCILEKQRLGSYVSSDVKQFVFYVILTSCITTEL